MTQTDSPERIAERIVDQHTPVASGWHLPLIAAIAQALADERRRAREECAGIAENSVECCGNPVENWTYDGNGNQVCLGAECCGSPVPKYPHEIAAAIRAAGNV